MEYVLKFGTNLTSAKTLFKGSILECEEFMKDDIKLMLGEKTPYSTRHWKEENGTEVIDFGSWSTFYYLVPEDIVEPEEEPVNVIEDWAKNYSGIRSLDTLLTDWMMNKTVISMLSGSNDEVDTDWIVVGYTELNDDILLSLVSCAGAMKTSDIDYQQINFMLFSKLMNKGCVVNYHAQFEE